MFLTDDDLRTLTGRARPSAQLRWLSANGYRHAVAADGRPVVLRAEVEARLSSGSKTARRTRPDFTALNGAA